MDYIDLREAVFFLVVATAYAQKEPHLKFMGIPLDGTINQFQSKLTAKGIRVDVALNKNIGVGARAFKGTFSGKDAQVFVYYDEYLYPPYNLTHWAMC